MKFDFKVDKLNVALNSIEKKFIDTEFAEYLCKKYEKDYKRIRNRDVFYDEDCSNMPIIQEVLKYKDFDKLVKKCEENCLRIQANLNEYKQEIELFLNKMSKTKLPNLNLDVRIVPWGGFSIYNTNIVVWGHEKGYKDKFYDLVYLYHEVLHKVFKREDISHCIIQELTDTKLANHFHPEMKDGYEKHAYIHDLQNNMQPFFDLYYGTPKNEVLKQLENDCKFDLYDLVKKIKKDLSIIDIFEFEKFMLKYSKKLEILTEKQAILKI